MSFAQDLRASVLKAAMQGQLTEQLPSDTNVKELYGKIMVNDDDWTIPNSWVLLKMKDVASHQNGYAFKPSDWMQSGTKIVRIQNLTSTDAPANYCNDSTIDKKFKIKSGDVLVSWSCTIDSFVYMGEDAVLNQHIFKVIFDKAHVDKKYYVYCIKALLSIINSQRHGSTMTHITKKDYENLNVPIPPIEEQKRIVRRIEEIMKHINELEAIEEELKKLKEAFPADMKAAVLQAAMQGKLTEQLETDSSVDDLLEDIKKERERLVKEGKIKKPKTQNNNFVQLDDVPFDIPSSWKWVYLNSIAYTNGGYAFQSSKYSNEGIRVVRISDFNNDGLLFNQIVRHPFSKDLEQYIIKTNDILMCMTGGTVGKCCIIDTIPEQMVTNQRVANISSVVVQPKFLHYALKSCITQDIIKQNKNSTNDNISMELILSLPIPLPPIEEQQRIVDKLETILPLIEGI